MTDEQAISAYQALNPTLFDILDRFDLSQHCHSDQQHELSIELWLRMYENEDDDPRRLRLTFEGVRNLMTTFQGFALLPRIAIRSIRDYRWERLRYEVKDEEGNTFSFFLPRFSSANSRSERMTSIAFNTLSTIK